MNINHSNHHHWHHTSPRTAKCTASWTESMAYCRSRNVLDASLSVSNKNTANLWRHLVAQNAIKTCNKTHNATETTSSSTSSRCIKADAHLRPRLHQKSSSCCRDIEDRSSPTSNTSSVAFWIFNRNKQQRF